MKTSTIAIIAGLILAVGAFFALGYITARNHYEKPVDGPDTVIVERWVRDTVKEVVPGPSTVKVVYLQVHDTTAVHDTTTLRDSIMVEVPIVERTFIGDNYKATVRGYDPELIDIWVKQKETTITVPYRKRWSFTVGPQAGFGFTPQGWQPYAGAGVTFGYSF